MFSHLLYFVDDHLGDHTISACIRHVNLAMFLYIDTELYYVNIVQIILCVMYCICTHILKLICEVALELGAKMKGFTSYLSVQLEA